MPAITLIICLHRQRELLGRLVSESVGCYDDLLVVHDGPDVDDIRSAVEIAGGRFYTREGACQQEQHWPFAWAQSKYDWILRLDADEYPSDDLKTWLQKFRHSSEPPSDVSGYTCFWPLWNGKSQVSSKWPSGRFFLFNRQRVRFFGMNEQSPIPDNRCEALDCVLHHEPKRKSFGLRNVLLRQQAWHWRSIIAESLLGNPTDLPCWRFISEDWPIVWEEVRQKPLLTALKRMSLMFLRELRLQWRADRRFYIEAALNGPLHHALICLKFWQLRRRKTK